MYQSILCVREMNVDGCGGFAQVFLRLDRPLTESQLSSFKTELELVKAEAEEKLYDTEAMLTLPTNEFGGFSVRRAQRRGCVLRTLPER